MRIKERLVIVEQVATDLVVANFVCQPVPEGKTEPVAREDDDRGLLPAQLADEVLLYRLRDRHADVVVARRGIEPQQVPEEARVVREVEDAFAGEDVRAHDRAQVTDQTRSDRLGRRWEDGRKQRLAIEDVSDVGDRWLAGCECGQVGRHVPGDREEAGRSSDQQHDQQRERHGVSRQLGWSPRRQPCLGCGYDAVDHVEEQRQRHHERLVDVVGAADVLDVVETDEDRRRAHRPVVHRDGTRVGGARGEIPDREKHQHDRGTRGEDVVQMSAERRRSLPLAERDRQAARQLMTGGERAVVEDEVVQRVL